VCIVRAVLYWFFVLFFWSLWQTCVSSSGKSSIGIPLEIAASAASRGFGAAAVDGNVFGEL
jgi:hypothetical protein